MTELYIEECVVCLENLEVSNTVRLMCDHELHIHCLHKLLSSTQEEYTLCPICRKLLCTHHNVTKYINFTRTIIAGAVLLFALSVFHISLVKYNIENKE